MTKKKVLKPLIVIFSLLALAFLVYNIIWLTNIYVPYKRYEKKSEIYESDTYEMVVAVPWYLGTNGFIAVRPKQGYVVHTDSNGESLYDEGMYMGHYTWIRYFGKRLYGIDMMYMDVLNDVNIDEQICVDENGEYDNAFNDTLPLTDEEKEFQKKLLDEYRDEVNILIEAVKSAEEL